MLSTLPTLGAERSAVAARPSASSAPAPDGPRFADVLQQRQATHGMLARPPEPPQPRVEAEGPAARKEPAAQDGESDGVSEAAANPGKPQATARPRVRGDKPPPNPGAKPAPKPLPAEVTAPETGAAPRMPAEGAEAPAGPAPAAEPPAWVAGLVAAASPTPASAATDAAAAAGTDTVADLAGLRPASSGRTPPSLRDPAEGDDKIDLRAAFGTALHGARDLASTDTFTAQAAEHRGTPIEPGPVREPTPGPLAGPAGAVPRGFDAATLAPIALPTPLTSPDFAKALGAQVSVLARDGLTQAELHLNPAEMGPISVQIAIEGAQARVDFGADSATTRQVIESGLPELAAALREQGLTLTGGGVFQQARRDADARDTTGQDGRPRRRGAPGPITAAPRAVALPRHQGRIDLYA